MALSPRPNKTTWTRSEIIATISLGIAVLGIVLALTQPEVRHFLGLSNSNPSALSTTATTPTESINSSMNYAFDFEMGTQNWRTSEGSYKLAKVDTTTNPVHSGSHALHVTTALLGNANAAYTSDKEVYRHTEATVYFDQVTANGFDTPGPYNLSMKRVSCFVYLPDGLDAGGNSQAYIRLFVKDKNFANDFSKAVTIDSFHVDTWFQVSLQIGADHNDADSSFNATTVNAIGVRIDTLDSSTLTYVGPFYIDDCSIEHP